MRPLAFLQQSAGERMLSIGFFRFMIGFSLFLILAEVALISWRVVPSIYGETAAPLHYNVHFGVDTIGAWWRIFTVPAVGLFLLVLNVFLARFFFSRERALSYIAASATIFLEVVLAVAAILIVLLNISYG